MISRATITAKSLGVAAGVLLLGAGIASAQGPKASDFGKPTGLGPPIPPRHMVLTPQQFGQPEAPSQLGQIQSTLTQQAKEKANPQAPHHELLEMGPPFHRDPRVLSPTGTEDLGNCIIVYTDEGDPFLFCP